MMLWMLLVWFHFKVAAFIANVVSFSCFARVDQEEG